jgi:uncharacterized membrane protein
VYASGVVEAAGAAALLCPGGEEIGGGLLVLLLWAVFPGNINHALSEKAQRLTKVVSAPLVF